MIDSRFVLYFPFLHDYSCFNDSCYTFKIMSQQQTNSSQELGVKMLSSLSCSPISRLRLKRHAARVYRQGPGCAVQACHAKICACVAVCNTMRLCKCTELCLWSGDIFRLWSAEWLGWAAARSAWIKMQCVDHCWVPLWWPASVGLTRLGRVGLMFQGLYLYTRYPQFNLVNTGISQAIFMAGCYDQQYLHLVTTLRGFNYTLLCVILSI